MEETRELFDTSSNMSEEEIIMGSEQQHGSVPKQCEGEPRNVEKRSREEDSTEDEQGFIKVQRASKRHARSNSDNLEEDSGFRVCIISKELLPKQFGMAKLLRSENIAGIRRIMYKNPYKAILYFGDRESGNKLMSCVSLINLGYRIQPADEMSLCYGIVRQADLEETDEEILKNLNSEFEIVSVRRLKRVSDSGVWVNSETIRLAFKGPTLPPYVFGYGCRFKVEKYTFPVTQCNGCWKFGHLFRSCPTRKIVCPKCAGTHANCETSNFKCVNCKGRHMALYKKCPTFLHEKEIRDIMTKKNCTYRNAFKIFSDKKQTEYNDTDILSEHESIEFDQPTRSHMQNKRSYRDVVIETEINGEMSTEEDDELKKNQSETTKKVPKQGKKKQKAEIRKEEQSNSKQQPPSWADQVFGESAQQSDEAQVKKKKEG
ncbi:jg17591, partial [Pararge aegeria aegeria]